MDLDRVRGRLHERLSQLLERVGRIQGDLRQPANRDWEEQAIEAENEEVLARLDASERREIEEIRAALQRVDQGSYGTCARCGDAIADGRLEALPYTSLCIACAE